MQIQWLELDAFGPFRARRLEFTPGFNVVWGPNESGKSTYHAALLALLCGVPAPEERRVDDQDFADRHRPWNGAEWAVSGQLALTNGAEIAIRRDLDRPGPRADGRPEVGGHGGQDLGEALTWEGSPDCSRWLGLNRRSFAVTAAVAQADVLRVVLSPGLLQDDLRRAAAGGGLEMMVERAADLLAVDLEDVILAALEDLARARDHLDLVVASRDRQVRLQREADEVQERTRRLALEVRTLEGALALRRAERAQERLARARELAAAHPERPSREEPPSPHEDQLRAAVQAWSARPEIPELSGPTLDELRARFEGLVDQPVEGDLVPDPGVLAAREVYEYANQELDRHWAARPPEPERVNAPLSSEVLRDLAEAIENSPAEPPPANVGRLLRRRDGDDRPHPVTYARMQGLEPDPESIRALAQKVAGFEAAQAEQKRWAARQRRLRQESLNSEARLRAALSSRGVEAPTGQVMQAVFQYVRECEERGRIAARTAEREHLAQQIRARELLESRRAQALAAQEHAAGGLRAVAKAADVEGKDPEELAVDLRSWLEAREQARAEREKARLAWQELTELLEGRSLEAVTTEAERRVRRARAFVREVGEEAIVSYPVIADGGEQLAQLKAQLEASERRLAEALRNAESAADLEHPAEAEEAFGEAARRLWELNEYRAALSLARERLLTAAAAVNADVAPALAAALRRWLPRISFGRYTEAWVDPATLQVDVRGPDGDWQPAGLVSHATAEQIYLLLRVALAKQLTLPGRSSPLFLDDVTVHADAARTDALLEVLHEVSAEQQVILFTGQDRVLAWAANHLRSPRDSVRRLDELTVAVTA